MVGGGGVFLKFILKIQMLGRIDNNIITGANTSELIVIVGNYPFDKNPLIGSMADINVWSR